MMSEPAATCGVHQLGRDIGIRKACGHIRNERLAALGLERGQVRQRCGEGEAAVFMASGPVLACGIGCEGDGLHGFLAAPDGLATAAGAAEISVDRSATVPMSCRPGPTG